MKKILLLLIFIFVFVFLKAQYFQGSFIFGLAGSQIDGDGFRGYNKVGIEFGAFVDYKLNKLLSLRSGILLIQKGSHSSQREPYFKTVIDQVEIPLWLNYYPYQKFGASIGLSTAYIYKAFYHSSYTLDREDLGIGIWDFTIYISFNYRISSFVVLRASYRYGLLPITRPIYSECWKESIYLSWLISHPTSSQVCWWTNTASMSLEIKIPFLK